MLVGMACLVGWTLADSSLAVTLLAGVTLTDGFAWAVGSIYGRVAKARGWEIWKFAPDISPKKTWPGTLGGILGGTLAAQPVAALVGFGVPLTPSLYSKLLVVCVAGVLGDLLQSYVKRKAGLKDAGGLLPGHGGVTERLDSVVFAFLTLTLLQFA
jgi:phosphatidate cytidylyltransferase